MVDIVRHATKLLNSIIEQQPKRVVEEFVPVFAVRSGLVNLVVCILALILVLRVLPEVT